MGRHVQDGAEVMSALIKKPQNMVNTVVDITEELGGCSVARLRVIDRIDHDGTPEVRIVVSRTASDGHGRTIASVTEGVAIKHTQDLDDLILALTELRGTYQ